MSNARRAARAAESPLHLDRADTAALTGQVNQAYAKLDAALAHTLRLQAAMIETGTKMGLEPETGQKLFKALNQTVNTMMVSREELLASHLQATKIRLRTNQAETADGCLPWPPPGGGIETEANRHLRAVA